ncbi:hypothetical protein B0H67DRAFT_557177 [Lasiosphaeris hirsuta]|uniref:Uncharacterized protein n=1 Tax=Lasiosphaeris hirsuta TaxID=260670 RepID=A0AA39ZVM2_9PEZI|nr:hypothetical protein B0H67DRAFT_557177 [Lasiosphaeris hirsuta]
MLHTTELRAAAPEGGSWLSDDPNYQNCIEKLLSSDPRLLHRDPPNMQRHIPWPPPHTRVSLFEAQSDDRQFWKQERLIDAALLREVLRKPGSGAADGRRIIILEGQAPAFIDALGTHFGIHPGLWVDHERRWTEELPSAMQENVSMKYFELIYLPPEMRKFHVCCSESGRSISATRVLGEFMDTGILHRKCTVWRRQRSGGKGWDCVIITDPPLRSVFPSYDSCEPIEIHSHSRPPRGGYADFVPRQHQVKVGSGPPRTCMLDDICFYLTRHPDLFGPDNGHDNPLRLCQKLVASHYSKQAGFLLSLVSYVQSSMTRQDKLDNFSAAVVEKQWSDMQSYERRVSIYCHELESIMRLGRIPLAPPESSRGGENWLDVGSDFQHLQAMIRDVQHRVELLSSSVTGLAGIAGNRQAIEEQMLSRREAMSMKALTIVGLVFLPLSFAASLFGMSPPYAFGEQQFWVYFALAVPLCAVAFGIYFVFGGSWARCRWFQLQRAGSRLRGDEIC